MKLGTRHEIICKQDYVLLDVIHINKDTEYYCWISESYDERDNYEGLVYLIKDKNNMYAISLDEEDFNKYCEFIITKNVL